MITTNDTNVTPFGGIHLIHKQVKRKKLIDFINGELGKRSANSTYSYSDLILNRCYIALCGGECAEDSYYLTDTFRHLKGLGLPSSDRILGMEKELATAKQVMFSDSGAKNELNINQGLNRFLLKTAIHLGVLEPGNESYCLDFDHQFIPTEKKDSAYSYKKKRGYFPGIASIGNVPVYVENRNGNSSVKFNQLDTLRRSFALIRENGISPARCRMDCGSYIKEVCNWLEEEQGTCKFYIRAEQSQQLLVKAADNEQWENIKIGGRRYQACSIQHKFGRHKHRVICYRWPNKTGQLNVMTRDANNYLFIITNDRQWGNKQIIRFYNKRGDSERLFDIQNNDFNWNRMPHGHMEQNTVYLIIMAVCHILYIWLLDMFSKAIPFLEPGQRLKRFIFRVVSIAAKVTRSGRRQVVQLFTKLDVDRIGTFP